jgi:hypothetical protein
MSKIPQRESTRDLQRQAISIAVIPDIFYRASILGSFRMDPRLQLAGMTAGEMDPCHRHKGMTEEEMDTRLKPRG